MGILRLVHSLPPGLRRRLKALPGMKKVRDRLYQAPAGPRPSPGELRPVVYLPTWAKWEVMRQRPQYLLDALARSGHQIYFVDPTADRPHSPSARVSVVPSLKATPPAGVIVYTHFAPTRTLLERYEDVVVVYDILDDLSIYDADEVGLPPERTVRYHHSPLVAEADVVIASNQTLVERHLSERPDLILVENGVDPTLFTPDGPAVDLGEAPVVGYHGAIAAWFDFDLVGQAADMRPDYSFVLVGPVLEGAEKGMESLLARPNVSHHREAPSDVVASFVRSFDVGLVPFLITEMTQGVTPLKTFEYLSTGVPVVSTELPASISHPDVLTVTDAAELARALDDAIALGPGERARLRDAGMAASWDRRIEPLLERLDANGLRRVR